jgi:hypothetical protein
MFDRLLISASSDQQGGQEAEPSSADLPQCWVQADLPQACPNWSLLDIGKANLRSHACSSHAPRAKACSVAGLGCWLLCTHCPQDLQGPAQLSLQVQSQLCSNPQSC